MRICALVSLLVLLPAAACGDGAAPALRNVVLITLDTTRADHLSCYGSSAASTPSLDALAADGTRFDLAVGTASVTPVAHAAILTGLYNHAHGLRVLFADGGYRLAPEVETLASILAGRGYHTVAVHSAFPVSRFFGLERGFAVCEDLQADMVEQEGDFRWDVGGHQRRSDETTDRVTAHLGSGPFFLWVHYWDPHDVFKLPPDLKGRDVRAAAAALPKGVQPLYAEEIEYMDAQIGRLLDELRARGLYDDALVVVVADHGQGLMDHGWPAHRLLYQEQIRVPLIVRVPEATRRGASVAELVRTVDILPTVLDYLGIPPPPVSGRSLRALIEGAPDAPRTALADQINGYDWNAGAVRRRPLDDFLYVAMDRDWKLTYRPMHFEESELYHLAEDPREEHDLFAARPEEALALLELLAREAPWVSAPFAPLASDPSAAEVQSALSALGYTGTAPVEARWEWTCPRHLDQRWEGSGGCPTCGGPPLLIVR